MSTSNRKRDGGLRWRAASSPALATFLARVIALAILGLPLTLILVGARQIVRYAQASHLPTVGGTVITSGVERITDPGQRIGDPATYTYRPAVTYSYRVSGKTVMGSRVTYLGESASEEWAQAAAAGYVPGAPVTVHFDPDNHGEAFLEAGGAPLISWLMLLMGLVPLAAWIITAARARARTAHSRSATVSTRGQKQV